MLSKNRESAVKALVVHLGYQGSVAESEVYTMPEEVVEEIVACTKERVQVPESIRSVLSRLYDRRREGHAKSATEEMDRQRRIVAARTVLENQLGMSIDDSVARTLPMTNSELDAIADTPLDVSCNETLTQLLLQSATRQEADAVAKAESDAAALAASEAAQRAEEERLAAEAKAAEEAAAAVEVAAEGATTTATVSSSEMEPGWSAAQEADAATAAAAPATEVVDATVVDPAAPAADPAPAVDPQP
ncbi:MAG: hypothetical protein ACO1RA_02300 [Planctomycetaceae bacterium]